MNLAAIGLMAFIVVMPIRIINVLPRLVFRDGVAVFVELMMAGRLAVAITANVLLMVWARGQ